MTFPENFFEKECRCNFEISTMMKRAWAAEMEVLQVVADICQKHNLQYYADWGTLLGAIRHKGFIPWDDDIDICMKREEYMKLIQLLPQELPYGFVMAGMYAKSKRLQDAAYVPHLRVMADETQWDFNEYMKKFHGFPYQRIGIDIFPLDAIPTDEEELTLQRNLIRQGLFILSNWSTLQKDDSLETYIHQYEKLCNVKIPQDETMQNHIWRLVDAISALYTNENTIEMADGGASPNQELCRLKREWYDNVIYVPFENIMIPIPGNYEQVLTTQFGDYMVYKRYAADHDYPFYGHMEGELIKQIKAVGFTGNVDDFCHKVSIGELHV